MALRFSPGGNVQAHRMEFLRMYCELPEEALLLDDWAAMSHPTSGWQVLHFLAQAVNRSHLQVPAGCTRRPLELLGGADSLVQALLRRRCDLDCPISQSAAAAPGFTALHLLAKPYQKWRPEELDDVLALAAAILQHGGCANPQVAHTGRTPLAIAASSGQEKMVRLLVRHGADPAAPEGDGVTPMELCRRGRQNRLATVLEELSRLT